RSIHLLFHYAKFAGSDILITIPSFNTLCSSGLLIHRALHSFPTRRSSDLQLHDPRYRSVYEADLSKMLPHIETPTDRQYFDQLRSEEHTSELQSRFDLVCRLPLEKAARIWARPDSRHSTLATPRPG